MNVDLERAGKPPRKLQKLLKKLPIDPAPETVHQLRTQTRKLEAILHALSPADEGTERRLLKILKPIRRAAGRVRDMDVLIAKTTKLSAHLQSDGVIRLVQHMAAIRDADATRLHRQVKRRRKKARSLLQSFRRDLKRLQAPYQSGAPSSSPRPQLLVQKLEHWPRLTPGNLHDFRKGVKELGYMLQLVPDQDEGRLEAYAKVKDTAGDWHDWLQLKCLADSVLDPRDDAPMLNEIGSILQEKFHTALEVANSLRKRGIEKPQAA
jgi:CHAD domain-containing protein